MAAITTISIRQLVNDEYITLFTNSNPCSFVSCQIWWSGLNAFNGVVSIATRNDVAAVYTDTPALTFTMDNQLGSGNGSCKLTTKAFYGGSLAVKLNKGSANTGNVFIKVNYG